MTHFQTVFFVRFKIGRRSNHIRQVVPDLGRLICQELGPKRIVLTFGTFKMSFPLKAYVVSRNEINSFKLSGFVLLKKKKKNEQRILLNLCSIRVLLPKSLRSSSYGDL